jgi:hypothetical protein
MTEFKTVLIELLQEDAECFESLSTEKKQILTDLLIKFLRDEEIDLENIMAVISYNAQKRGLTPEILEEILKEENP